MSKTTQQRIGRTIGESVQAWPEQRTAPEGAPNIVVIVLDDGEKIEGSIEWYDHNVIKVRAGSSSPFRNGRLGESATRVLIYKSSIKYLFKAGENSTL